MHADHLIVPNEAVCEVIPQEKCRFHILQYFSIDWEITRRYHVKACSWLGEQIKKLNIVGVYFGLSKKN